MKKFDRRSFLKTSSLSAAAIASTSLLSSCVEPKVASKGIYMGGFAAPKIDYLRAAFIVVGVRGVSHLRVIASIAQDGAPQQFPDFTATRWKETPPLRIIS
jgi:hypothetical protein